MDEIIIGYIGDRPKETGMPKDEPEQYTIGEIILDSMTEIVVGHHYAPQDRIAAASLILDILSEEDDDDVEADQATK